MDCGAACIRCKPSDSMDVHFPIASISQNKPYEANELVFGRVGKFVSLLYLWFAHDPRLQHEGYECFRAAKYYAKNSNIVVLIAFILVCAFAVRNGIKVVTRYSTIFTIVAATIVLITTILTFNVMDFENFCLFWLLG